MSKIYTVWVRHKRTWLDLVLLRQPRVEPLKNVAVSPQSIYACNGASLHLAEATFPGEVAYLEADGKLLKCCNPPKKMPTVVQGDIVSVSDYDDGRPIVLSVLYGGSSTYRLNFTL